MKRFFLYVVPGVFALASLPAVCADVANGSQLYTQYCADCHGPDPRKAPIGDFVMQGANNPAEIQSAIVGITRMHSLANTLTDANIDDIAAYLGSLLAPNGTPKLSLSAPWVMFPAQQTGTSSSAIQLGLSNTGTAALTLGNIAVSAADFTLTTTCGASLAAGGSCQLMIVFKPGSLGVINAAFTIASNAANSPATVPVSGTGWDGVTATAAGTVVEYYNPDLDNFFITADPNEQAFVDSGAVGHWRRTRLTFKSGGPTQVCRFYGNTAVNPATGNIYGPNSHFYTAIQPECDQLKAIFSASVPSWKFESLDFATSQVNTDGSCPAGTLAIYRAYDNGNIRGVDSNHRITASQAAIAEVLAHGWKSEGVVMCAPQ